MPDVSQRDSGDGIFMVMFWSGAIDDGAFMLGSRAFTGMMES